MPLTDIFNKIENSFSDPHSKIALNNLKFDWKKGCLPAQKVEEFLNLVITEIGSGGSSKPTSPLPFYFRKVLTKQPLGFLFCSTRLPKIKEKYVRVMDVLDFFEYNVESKIKALYEKNTATSKLYWDLLEKETVNPNHYSGEMKCKEPCNYFWATTENNELYNLLQINKISNNTAVIRNILGLYKHKKNARLLCIYIPNAVSILKKVISPTTLDSFGDYVFLPSDNPNGYGTTLNLETLEEGVEEILVEKLRFNKDGKFPVKLLKPPVEDDPPHLDLTILSTKSMERANT